jgi:3-oxoadipate enol-lactonase
VIAGRHDPATTLQAGEYLRDHIPGVAFTVLEAAHISNVEQPAAFSNAVLEFLLQRH